MGPSAGGEGEYWGRLGKVGIARMELHPWCSFVVAGVDVASCAAAVADVGVDMDMGAVLLLLLRDNFVVAVVVVVGDTSCDKR